MSNSAETQFEEALCPKCGKPATRIQLFGWLFRCQPCRREWGHPQAMTREEAQEALYEAWRREATP